MDSLSVEIATGFVTDKASHLGGDITELLSIDRNLAKLETYRVNTSEAGLVTSTMQTTLDEIQSRSEALSQDLMKVELTQTDEMFSTLSASAESSLDQMMNGLNRSIAGRFLFSGTATDTPPLVDSEALLAELETVLSGATTVAGVESALDTWFDTAGGGFDTFAYKGSTTSLAPMRLSSTESAQVDIRADDDVFRETLKAVAKAALASNDVLGFSTEVKSELISNAALNLQSSQARVVELRAGLGALEGRIEDTVARNSSERTAMMIARTELVGTDEYEAATAYENTRSQLEAIYAITVRSSRMSLVGYL
ncbi:flagellar hook-associated protein FlgL family protein [Citreicella sp. 357]|nr:flagellar hook-associated protein FlgL family protein [Citreicella sp. 357]